MPEIAGCLLLAILLSGTSAEAADVIRGPYLQRVSRSQAIVRWRTDVATGSQVWWGDSPEALVHHRLLPDPVTEHRVEIGPFQPRQTVYYKIGWGAGLFGGPVSRFRTLRAAGDWRPVRLWALGDSGRANADAAAVRDGYSLYTGGELPDFLVMLGDNAYLEGTDEQYQAAVFDFYPVTLAGSALWPALGNHDAVSSDSPTQSGPFFDSFSLPRGAEAGGISSGTEAWYSFDAGQIHLVALDSADSDCAPGSPMLLWLAADLAANTRPWTVVYFHHPPYTKGTHDSDDPADSDGRMTTMRENVLPILEAHGVDLVLSGHSHGYERSYLIDGHYGTSDSFQPSMLLDGGDGDPDGDGAYSKSDGAHGGTVYVVGGSSGGATGKIGVHPAMAVGLVVAGSLDIVAEDDRLDVRFIDSDGLVGDHFRIVEGGLVFADGFESDDFVEWSLAVP
ncbi:MAG: purple acid phosphatase family protein [Thermoanaerobaculia bacterium]